MGEGTENKKENKEVSRAAKSIARLLENAHNSNLSLESPLKLALGGTFRPKGLMQRGPRVRSGWQQDTLEVAIEH
jgi:hypothetical protein